MKQTNEANKRDKVHYDIYGYTFNPALDDPDQYDEKATVKFQASTKREIIGLLKTVVDNYNFEHIAIFKVKE